METGVYPVARWYQSMEGKAPINYGATVSHHLARFATFHPGIEALHYSTNTGVIAALGLSAAGANRPAGPSELQSIRAALGRGFDEGALGLGVGINYTPAAGRDEVDAIFRVAGERKAPAFVHVRSFGIGPMKEAIDHAREAGAALHILHVTSMSLWDLSATLALIDSSRAAGQDVTTEVYPYNAASTALESAFFNPGWREAMRIDYADLEWVATGERLTKESFDRYRQQGGAVIIYSMTNENVERAIAHPGVIVASDGLPYVNGKAHPRGAGTFARLLGHLIRNCQRRVCRSRR